MFPGLLALFRAGFRSMLFVPLISKDQVIGNLNLASTKPNVYAENELKLAEKVNNQIAGAIANAQLFADYKRTEKALLKSEEEAKWLARENAAIAEMGRIISSTLKIEEVYERFAEEVRMLIPFDRIVINLNNYEDNTFCTAYVAGGYIGNRCSGDVAPLPGSVNEEMVRTRKGLLFHLEREDEIADRFPVLLLSFCAGFRSMLFAPLISNDEVIGCLNLQSTKPNVYTENDLRLAEKVSHQIAGAIANAQLFDAYKRAEKGLRESEERFRDLYDNAPFGYHEYDREGRIVNVNRTDLEMLGYTREEMVGQFVWKFSAEEETVRDEILAKLAGTLPCGRSLERIYRRKDGTTFPVLVGERVLLDKEGNIKGFLSTIQDITDLKEIEEALIKSWSRYRTLFNSSGDAILIHDLEGRVLEVNQIACDRLGYSQDEFAQMTLGQIVSSEHAASVPRLIEEERTRGRALFETVHVSKDGRTIPTEVSGVVFEYDGHPAVLSSGQRHHGTQAYRGSSAQAGGGGQPVHGWYCRCKYGRQHPIGQRVVVSHARTHRFRIGGTASDPVSHERANG